MCNATQSSDVQEYSNVGVGGQTLLFPWRHEPPGYDIQGTELHLLSELQPFTAGATLSSSTSHVVKEPRVQSETSAERTSIHLIRAINQLK